MVFKSGAWEGRHICKGIIKHRTDFIAKEAWDKRILALHSSFFIFLLRTAFHQFF